MNIERPRFEKSMPTRVRPTGDEGVYEVRSYSRPDHYHRVDVTLLQCDCESATIGESRKKAKANGGCPPFNDMCRHLKCALVYYALEKLNGL